MVRALSLLVALTAASVAAQDVEPQLSGRLDSSFTWMAEEQFGWGSSTGWAGLTAGTKDVKTELRASFQSLTQPSLSLSRAWVKFRFPGMRLTTGLGRLAWGTGFVLVPGDLMFEPGTELDFGGDELRRGADWLGDAWFSLGDEAYFEAAVRRESAGARISAAPFGMTVELAGAWDQARRLAKAALSTQFHAGADWYATLRQDSDPPVLGSTTASAGAFGLWTLFEDVSLSSRHEVQSTGAEPLKTWESYHDATVSYEGLSLTGRLLANPQSWSPSAEVRWAPLQNLALYGVTTLEPPFVVRVGATSKW